MASLRSLLRRNRAVLDLELRDSPARMYATPALLALHAALLPRLRAHVRGRVLDAGGGTMPFRRTVASLAREVHGLDIERKVPDIDFVADVQEMGILADASYDTVLATEVLEHVPHPERALAEIHRVLKPGGTLLLTVPFLARLHDEPYDFFRYTRHGLRVLLEAAGLRVIEIEPTGGLLCFLGHQVSSVLLLPTWRVPILKWIVFGLNAVLCTLPCRLLDHWFGGRATFPLGYVAVASKSRPA